MTHRIEPASSDISLTLLEFLKQYTQQEIGVHAPISLQFAAHDDAGRFRGGVTGRVSHGVLAVQLLAVSPDARQSGLGKRLLQTLENAAIEQGATVARVDTLEFEAPDFYQKQGYEIFGVIGDQVGRRQFFLFKKLDPKD